MRYFILLSYDGTAYHGWQRQPNAVSVQQQFEDILRQLFGRYIPVVAAGRTDTGVHARMMAAHFDMPQPIDTERMAFKFNCLLPPDISVSAVRPVTPDAHARFSALSRTYHYTIYLRKNPFLRPFACRLYYQLDFNRMNEAAQILLRHTDFGCFCKAHSSNKTNICHITRAVWREVEPDVWRFEITADRFLRNMVRAIVGTLVDVGRGRLTLEGFEQVILSQKRTQSGDSMPACGLALVDITYPDNIWAATCLHRDSMRADTGLD